MLVEELIEELEKLDPKLRVVRAGYEGGLADVAFVGLKKIALNVNSEWYYGNHEPVEPFGYQDLSGYEQVDAVYVG